MAKARFVPPIPEPRLVELTLTEAEARVLLDMCGSISGSPDESNRAHTDAIYEALTRLKVTKPHTRCQNYLQYENGKEDA